MMLSEVWLLSRGLTEGPSASVSLHVDLKPYPYLLSKGLYNLCDGFFVFCVLSLLPALVKPTNISCISTLK